MTVKTEGQHAGEFLKSEANGSRSREVVTIVSGQSLVAGEVVGIVTASGKYATYDAGAADGTETAAGIAFAAVDASAGDKDGVIIARDAEVNGAELVGIDADAITDLAGIGIIVR